MEMRRKTKAEQLAAIREEQARYDSIKVAIGLLTEGAVSATISTAGGSQSYTRAQISDLRALLRVSAARLDRLIARYQGQKSGPRRAYVAFD